MRIKSLFLKMLITYFVLLFVSHAVLNVAFYVLFQNSLTNIHLNAEDLNQLKYLSVFASLISLLVTSVLTFYLSQRMTAPLREMKQVALRIARGQFDQRVNIKT